MKKLFLTTIPEFYGSENSSDAHYYVGGEYRDNNTHQRKTVQFFISAAYGSSNSVTMWSDDEGGSVLKMPDFVNTESKLLAMIQTIYSSHNGKVEWDCTL